MLERAPTAVYALLEACPGAIDAVDDHGRRPSDYGDMAIARRIHIWAKSREGGAAIAIQRVCRARLVGTAWKERRHAAAATLQRLCRGAPKAPNDPSKMTRRTRWYRRRQAAIKFQSAWRGRRVRAAWREQRRVLRRRNLRARLARRNDRAAAAIQSAARGRRQRSDCDWLFYARARKAAHGLRRRHAPRRAAAAIQGRWRSTRHTCTDACWAPEAGETATFKGPFSNEAAWWARRRRRDAAIAIQGAARRFLSLQKWRSQTNQDALAQLRQERQWRRDAAARLQGRCRGRLARSGFASRRRKHRRNEELERLVRQEAACKIQAQMRGRLARKEFTAACECCSNYFSAHDGGR